MPELSQISHAAGSAAGMAPSPPPSPEEDDFFAWAKQAAAWAMPMDPDPAAEAQEEAPHGLQEEEEKGLELGPENGGKTMGKTLEEKHHYNVL